ncbi:hypothetical protein EIN_296830 [Entamoeba invadens IP1]|uniref:Peptidase S59 domain-containing protein n=1 Tax=Entamoeba invadens IP1 TaxID=370355 RepID=L7FKG9_ENTIV|nr:hypothetical protein EIN_296830 [Entamoeba invadens IP1]ELP86363.1 hypothetical protein EIN_296830 [Entamoeba invadens IP1]|eukprot:XP_004185709.1 hypothetical protein EIN_296830 [Entamoeba invadens IP1]
MLNPNEVTSFSLNSSIQQNQKQKEKEWNYNGQQSAQFYDFVRTDELSFSSSNCIVEPKVIESILTSAEKEIESLRNVGGFKAAPSGLKEGYVTEPSFEELRKYPIDVLKCLPVFKIKRVPYGEIVWENVDVTDINLAVCVFIEKGSVEVYPDGVQKPLLGQKLNKAATVTLNGVVEAPEIFKKMLPNMMKRLNVIDHNDETRSVTFTVPHFTKYAFIEEEEENEQQKKECVPNGGMEKEHIQDIEKVEDMQKYHYPVVTLEKCKICPFEIDF